MQWAIVLLTGITILGNGFKTEHKKNARVKKAYESKEKAVSDLLSKQGLKADDLRIFLRALKEEKKLELWGSSLKKEEWKLIKTYAICSASGDLGPKRKEGDLQVPEGFYHIEERRFNPVSSFHLSLGLNYPNASDKVLSDKKKPGGDIYIHGACASIGCLAMTDDFIQEIYVLAVEARNNGQQNIPVHVFPCYMTDSNLSRIQKEYPQHKAFWTGLQKGYTHFEKQHKLPSFVVNAKGDYVFK